MSEAEAVLVEDQDDLSLVKRMQDGREQIVEEIRKVIIGQQEIIDELLIALFAGGALSGHRRAGTGEDFADQDRGRHPAGCSSAGFNSLPT